MHFGHDLHNVVLLSAFKQCVILIRGCEIMFRDAGHFLCPLVSVGPDPYFGTVSDPECRLERPEFLLAEILVDEKCLITHAVISIKCLGFAILHHVGVELPVSLLYARDAEPGILPADDRL